MKQYRLRVLFTCIVMLGALGMFAMAAMARHQPKHRVAASHGELMAAADKILELGYQCKINGASLDECRALLQMKLAERGVR
jgi:hypothetical protein